MSLLYECINTVIAGQYFFNLRFFCFCFTLWRLCSFSVDQLHCWRRTRSSRAEHSGERKEHTNHITEQHRGTIPSILCFSYAFKSWECWLRTLIRISSISAFLQWGESFRHIRRRCRLIRTFCSSVWMTKMRASGWGGVYSWLSVIGLLVRVCVQRVSVVECAIVFSLFVVVVWLSQLLGFVIVVFIGPSIYSMEWFRKRI